MNSELMGVYTADKIDYEMKFFPKIKARIPRKQLTPVQKKSKRKMKQASQRRNRR